MNFFGVAMNKLILIEFNELCPDLLNKWMASGDLPNFKKLHDQSDVYTTVADETEPHAMEPWIQWYSIHTGLPYVEHGVFHLTDGPRAKHIDIWGFLNNAGKTVWNCSSMNARQFSFPGSAYLPDPWCTSEKPFPTALGAFHRFVSLQVREYSNKNYHSSRKIALDFISFMCLNGLRLSTGIAVLKQFISEIFANKTKWRRVALQDRFQFDVFQNYFEKLHPDFSTFFANSTAHLQHSYWRHMAPEQFIVKPETDELNQYKDAIQYGYMQMDRLLGDMMDMAGSKTRLMFATALSQQPYLKYEHVGGHNFYRPRNINHLFEKLNLKPKSLQPVMTHQFLAKFDSVTDAIQARDILGSFSVNGSSVFGFSESESDSIYFGCQIRESLSVDTVLESTGGPILNHNFFETFYKIEGLKSGRHHPNGCLWIQTGKHKLHQTPVSILDIFPTIAQLMNVPAEGYIGTALAAP